jgi:hypothetical protein
MRSAPGRILLDTAPGFPGGLASARTSSLTRVSRTFTGSRNTETSVSRISSGVCSVSRSIRSYAASSSPRSDRAEPRPIASLRYHSISCSCRTTGNTASTSPASGVCRQVRPEKVCWVTF